MQREKNLEQTQGKITETQHPVSHTNIHKNTYTLKHTPYTHTHAQTHLEQNKGKDIEAHNPTKAAVNFDEL